jgi:hypothetical protein
MRENFVWRMFYLCSNINLLKKFVFTRKKGSYDHSAYTEYKRKEV